MVFHCKMYPYSVATAVPITDWLYDPPVITNWTLLIPTPAEAVALRIQNGAGPVHGRPVRWDEH